MSHFEDTKNAEDNEPKPSKLRSALISVAIAAVVLFGGGATFVSNQTAPENAGPANAVEILPACPVMYIYPSDGSARKVIVPEQSNCTEENAGRVMEVRVNESGQASVTHSTR